MVYGVEGIRHVESEDEVCLGGGARDVDGGNGG